MIRRHLADLSATLLRIGLVFALLTLVFDAGARLAAQLAPASFYFSLTRVEILPTGRIAMIYRSSRWADLPVSVVTELIGPNDFQPCASSGRRIIEADTTYAVVPIARALPDCRWDRLPDGEYRLQVTGSYPAGGAYDKSITVRSENAIVVRGGMITSATPAPAWRPS